MHFHFNLSYVFCVLLLFTDQWTVARAFFSFFYPLTVGQYGLSIGIQWITVMLSFLTFLLGGTHIGYQRQTIHTVPEYEQIIETLDVDEQTYLERKKGLKTFNNIVSHGRRDRLGFQKRIGTKGVTIAPSGDQRHELALKGNKLRKSTLFGKIIGLVLSGKKDNSRNYHDKGVINDNKNAPSAEDNVKSESGILSRNSTDPELDRLWVFYFGKIPKNLDVQ